MCGYLYRLWMPTSAESRPSHTHNPSETFLECLSLALSLLEIGIQGHRPHNQHKNASDDILDMTCHRSCWWWFPPKNRAVIRSLGIYEFNPHHEKEYSPYEIHL